MKNKELLFFKEPKQKQTTQQKEGKWHGQMIHEIYVQNAIHRKKKANANGDELHTNLPLY